MVNVEEFSKRLTIVMNYYEISAASLAEKIDVQRSSISHLLSGRNKPSLEFVLKILKNFPEVELYWLLNGQGNFPKENRKEISTPTLFSSNEEKNMVKENLKPTLKNAKDNSIERIVVFYNDGTFRNYNP
ncbi:MAG: helix-turn-helix transcriptional regulator [Lutibacter sp.]|uniref:helix-turn-helix transcriptional regulator n=1 Tax=Lutibacter sp. TaxID=1925666 RepID=UPI00385846D6